MPELFKLKIPFNDRLVEAFKTAISESKTVPENIKQCLNNGSYFSFEEIEWLHKNTKETGKFHDLISGSKIILPEPIPPPRNPELEARIKKLKAQQENREYRKMTKNVDNVRIHRPDETIGFQLKQINRQLIAVFQFVLSVVAGFAFGFIGIELIVGDLAFGFRLLLGVICSLIIALAEIYFLAKKLAEEMESYDNPPIKKHQD